MVGQFDLKPVLDEIAVAMGDISSGKLGICTLLSIDNLDMILACQHYEQAQYTLDSFYLALRHHIGLDKTLIQLNMHQCIIIGRNLGTERSVEELLESIVAFGNRFGSQQTQNVLFLKISLGSVLLDQKVAHLPSEAIYHRAFVALRKSQHHLGIVSSLYTTSYKAAKHAKDMMFSANFLYDAICNNALRLAFQPIICSKTGKTESYECLLRIVQQDGTITSVGPFISSAEDMEFISKVDLFVLEAVVAELQKSLDVRLSFNVSIQSIHEGKWIMRARELLTDESVASRLTIEITETGLHHDLRTLSKFVLNMQELGCRVALDDFGAGYTSFQELTVLPVDMVKIDGSFVKNMLDSVESKLFLKTLLQFTKNFGLKTVAEFVETGEIAKSLMALDVDYMQGYYFSPALNQRPWLG